MAVAAALLGSVLGSVLLTGPANAHVDGVLPPIGAQVSAPVSGQVTFSLSGRSCAATVSGSLTERVDSQNPATATDTVTVTAFGLSGTRQCTEGGTVSQDTIGLAAGAPASGSLAVVQQFPPKYQQTLAVNLTMTSSDGTFSGPTTADFTGTPTAFPPRSTPYQLSQPVQLGAATISGFPLTVG